MAASRPPIQIRRTLNGGQPSGLAEGQLAVEMAAEPYARVWVGVPTSVDPAGVRLINPTIAGFGVFYLDVEDNNLYFIADSTVRNPFEYDEETGNLYYVFPPD